MLNLECDINRNKPIVQYNSWVHGDNTILHQWLCPDLSKSPAKTEHNIFHLCYEHIYQNTFLLDTSEVAQW